MGSSPLRTVITLVTLCGVWATAAAAQTDAAAIRARRAASNASIARHDTVGVAAILAPDVMVLTSTSAAIVGRDRNVALFARQFATRPDVVYRRTPLDVRVNQTWAMASESGTWTGSWSEPDGKVAIGGRYFAKWRRINGDWLVESETYVPERCTGSSYCTRATR